MSGHPWPLFDLRLRTPRLELRLPTDDDLLELVGIVDRIHGATWPGPGSAVPQED